MPVVLSGSSRPAALRSVGLTLWSRSNPLRVLCTVTVNGDARGHACVEAASEMREQMRNAPGQPALKGSHAVDLGRHRAPKVRVGTARPWAALQGLPGALQSVSIISRIEKRRTNSVEQLGQR